MLYYVKEQQLALHDQNHINENNYRDSYSMLMMIDAFAWILSQRWHVKQMKEVNTLQTYVLH
jgi:hypothetical protein